MASSSTSISKTFRLNCKNVFCTYPGHLDEQAYSDFVKNKCPDNINEIWVAHETSEDGYEHTHALLMFSKKINWAGQSCLDFNKVHGNYESVKNVNASKLYIQKQNLVLQIKRTSNDKFQSKIETLLNEDSDLDAIKSVASNFSEVSGILAVRELWRPQIKRKYLKFQNVKLFPWQESLNSLLKEEPNDRTIFWVVDEIGNSGKSFYSQYMEYLDHNKYINCQGMGRIEDAALIIKNALRNGWESWCIFIDLSRATENQKSIYNIIEQLKNGKMCSTKYNSNIVDFDTPHVVVFSNWWPMLRWQSADRWNLYNITNNNLNSVTLAEAESRFDLAHPDE